SVPEKAGDLDRQRLLQPSQLFGMAPQIARVRLDPRKPQGPDAHQEPPLKVALLVARQVEPVLLDQMTVDRLPGLADLRLHAHDRARTGAKYRFRLQERQPAQRGAESVVLGDWKRLRRD